MNKISSRSRWIWAAAALAVGMLGAASRQHWQPVATRWLQGSLAEFRHPSNAPKDSDHDDGEHDHAAHDTAREFIALSDQALRNVGLSSDYIRAIELSSFQKSITVPGVVAARPGRTNVQIATPMTGVVTHVHVVQGEALSPGTLVLKIRLTHEDLVKAQTDFLRSLGELDVEEREIRRLSQITSSGAVAGKVLLEREYARDKLTAMLQAQRESLRLHGLSDEQIDTIAHERRLLRELHIFAPTIDSHEDDEEEFKLTRMHLRYVAYRPHGDDAPADAPLRTPLILHQLNVHKGQAVSAGETLCVLADYSELFIEGMAFETDALPLRNASKNDWPVSAILEGENRVLEQLDIAYVSNHVDTNSRSLRFYVRLPNHVVHDRQSEGLRFVEWAYLPGQRLQLRIPVEVWQQQIVVPVEAVARDGAEYFVFQQNGDHFDRVPVHVKYRDQRSVVVENNGSLFRGDVIAMRGAHQLQMALKNKAGGAIDPHAGHSH